MNPIVPIQEDLRRLDYRYALVGGHAVSVRCEPRFTKDVDLTVSVSSDADAESLVRQLHERGYRVVHLLEHEPTGRLGTVRLILPGSESFGPELDLLFASSGIEPEVVAAAEPLEIDDGVTVPVATRGHLIALKVLSADPVTRPQDAIDLRALLARASADDLESARDALSMITQRGFDRGKHLQLDLDRLLRRPSDA